MATIESIGSSENYIKQLHSVLLRHSEQDVWHRGEYKKHSNSVEAFDPDGKRMRIMRNVGMPWSIRSGTGQAGPPGDAVRDHQRVAGAD